MAGVGLQVKDQAVRQRLGALKGKLRNFGPVTKLMAIHMHRSVVQNFQAGGRPEKWIPSKRVLREGGVTLSERGLLKGSLTPSSDATSARVSTTKVYARIHQLGGEIQQARRLKVKQQRRKGFARRKKITATQKTGAVIRMPARPYLLVQAEDRPILLGLAREYLRRTGTA
jgi:phage gpG-like protein